MSDSEIQLENYNVRRRDRNRRGGGVCVYVRSDLAFNPLDELYHDELEATWIELILPKTKPIVLGAVYRPPLQTDFYDVFEAVCLNNSLFYDRECFVLGDFNTSVTGSKRCNLVKNLDSCLDLLNLSQIITDYTRVSSSMSSTTIDLVLVSDKDKVSQSGVIDIGISDHCLVYCTRKVTKNTFNKHNTVKVRSMKNYNPETFQTNLLNADWHQVIFFFFFFFFLSAPPPLSDTIFFRISCEIIYVLFTNLQSVINKKEIMRVCMYVSTLHTPTHAHAHTHTHDGNWDYIEH